MLANIDSLREHHRTRLVALLFEARSHLGCLHPLRHDISCAIVADTEAHDVEAAERSIAAVTALIRAVLALSKNELLHKHCAAMGIER